jgi:hypothetical protein
MDTAVVKNAIGALEKALAQTKRALWEVAGDMYGWCGDEHGSYEHPRLVMAWQLEELHDVLLVVLEAAQMPEARLSLVEAWSGFTSAKDGLGHTKNDHENEDCRSPALTLIERLVAALRMTVSQQITSEQAWTLARLEAMLEDTPALVHRCLKPPAEEADLRAIMHDYLSACFSDFRENPPIGGTVKNFEPDCGIASIEAAIEFKFALTEAKARVAFTGIVEDTGGYKGSNDWTRFYAVMYQAHPFILKSHLDSDMKRIGAATWKAILANGATSPKIVKKRMPNKKSA